MNMRFFLKPLFLSLLYKSTLFGKKPRFFFSRSKFQIKWPVWVFFFIHSNYQVPHWQTFSNIKRLDSFIIYSFIHSFMTVEKFHSILGASCSKMKRKKMKVHIIIIFWTQLFVMYSVSFEKPYVVQYKTHISTISSLLFRLLFDWNIWYCADWYLSHALILLKLALGYIKYCQRIEYWYGS